MLDFPATPTTGQIYNGTNGVTYRWDGAIWVASGASAGGDFCANQTSSFPASVTATFTTVILTQVLTGNSGGWYSTSTGRFTPPAGRYAIYASYSAWLVTGTNFGVNIRKNGVQLADGYMVNGTGGWANPCLSLIVDANGSDWFDMQWNAGTTATTFENITFQAFPVSGIKGPAGDPHGYLGGDFCATQGAGFPAVGAAWVTLTPPVSVGNIGNHYNVANGRFTPPAGRYFIHGNVTGITTAASAYMGLQIRKNGVLWQDAYAGIATGVWYGNPEITIVVDASGSDWFDFQVICSAGAGSFDSVTFLAYPISGIKGPPGDQGGSQLAYVSDTPPVSPVATQLWFNSATGQLMIYYNDTSSTQWVPASPTASTPPATQSILLHNSANITVGTTSVPLLWDTVSYNSTGSTFNSGTGEFTVPAGMGGTWLVQATLTAAPPSVPSYIYNRLFLNGVNITVVQTAFTGAAAGNASVLGGMYRFAAGDKIIHQASASVAATTIYVGGATRSSWLHMTRLGA